MREVVLSFFATRSAWIAALIAALVLLDFAHAWRARSRTRSADVACNLTIGAVDAGLRAITQPVRVAAFVGAAALTPLRLETTWITVAAGYLAVDLTLYGWHRVLHETELGWAMHSVHHSSSRYDLSLGLRASWAQRLFDDLVYVPIALAGLDPLVLLVLIDLNRLGQLWTHTEAIGRLPLLDAFLDTPSNHRVHHHVTRAGRAANYGSTFVLWDRLFGTYRAETRREPYGSDLGELGANPWRVQWAGLRAWLARRRGATKAVRA